MKAVIFVGTLVLMRTVIGNSVCAAEPSQIDHDGIQKTLLQHASDSNGCLTEAAKRDAKLSGGKISIRFDVGEHGEVSNARGDDSKSTTTDQAVKDCLVGKMRSWKFPASPVGDVMDVTIPFTIPAAPPAASPAADGA